MIDAIHAFVSMLSVHAIVTCGFPKKLVFFIVYLSIVLTLFILSTLYIGPVFHVTLFAMFNRKGTATCNCLIDVLSKLLLKTSIRHWKATVCGNIAARFT